MSTAWTAGAARAAPRRRIWTSPLSCAGIAEGEDGKHSAPSEPGSSIREVLSRVDDARRRAGRAPDAVTVVAVTKSVPVPRIREAVRHGLSILGENRVQEAIPKIRSIPGVRWHLIGALQSNKARRAAELFAMIQSVDSLALAQRLDVAASARSPGGLLPVLLQVNVDADPAKAGFARDEVVRVAADVAALRHLEVRGLMTVGRRAASADGARGTFASLRLLAEEIRGQVAGIGPELSMGMSEDYEVAIEEGATIIRLGRALFGDRG